MSQTYRENFPITVYHVRFHAVSFKQSIHTSHNLHYALNSFSCMSIKLNRLNFKKKKTNKLLT